MVLTTDARCMTFAVSAASDMATTAYGAGSVSAAKKVTAPASVNFSPGAGSIGRRSEARASRAMPAAIGIQSGSRTGSAAAARSASGSVAAPTAEAPARTRHDRVRTTERASAFTRAPGPGATPSDSSP